MKHQEKKPLALFHKTPVRQVLFQWPVAPLHNGGHLIGLALFPLPLSLMISAGTHRRFYFFIFACLGLISPYLGWWLNSVLPETELKFALMVFNATLIVIPTVWGHFAFSSPQPGRWLSHGTIAACIFALGLTQVSSQISLAATCFLILAFGVFFNPLLPLLEAMTYHQMKNPQTYSKIRLFGSIGFMMCSFLIGGVLLIEHPRLFPYLVAGLLFVCWISSWPYKQMPPIGISTVEPVVVSSKKTATPQVLRSLLSLHPLWVVTCLVQAAFACYYAFFALHLQHIVSSGWIIGALIALATASEIVAFLKIDWFFKKWSPITLIGWACALLLIRWTVLSQASVALLPLVLVLQLTQAVGFSVFHTACLKLIHDRVTPLHVGAAQGFYNAIGYGVGGCVGVFVGGVLWETQKGQGVFVFAAGLCALALVWCVGWRWQQRSAPMDLQ